MAIHLLKENELEDLSLIISILCESKEDERELLESVTPVIFTSTGSLPLKPCSEIIYTYWRDHLESEGAYLLPHIHMKLDQFSDLLQYQVGFRLFLIEKITGIKLGEANENPLHDEVWQFRSEEITNSIGPFEKKALQLRHFQREATKPKKSWSFKSISLVFILMAILYLMFRTAR